MKRLLPFAAVLIIAGLLLVGVGYGLVLSLSGTCRLTVRGVGSGTIKAASGATWLASPGSRSDSIAENSVVTFMAVPSSGWVFSHWDSTFYQHYNPESQGLSVTLTADGTITATFTIIQGTPRPSIVTITVVGQGTTVPTVGPHLYVVGDNVEVACSAVSGWRYYGTYRNSVLWTTANPAGLLNVQANENVTVLFIQNDASPPLDEPEIAWSWATWLKALGYGLVGLGLVVAVVPDKKKK